MESKNEMAFAKCNAIRDLNKVEGFNPMDYISSSKNERGEEYINLETKYRQLWFRLCYPNGKITKKFLRLTDAVAAVEARVYLDKNDPEENYVASGVAQRFFNGNNDFGVYYLESAETIAEGRALAKAGFGIQFCDVDGQKDDAMPEVGVKVLTKPKTEAKVSESKRPLAPVEKSLPDKETKPDTKVDVPDNADTGQVELPFEEPSKNDATELPDQPPAEKVIHDISAMTEIIDTPADASATYNESTPVEEILKVMTVQDAENIVVTAGLNKGKTLRQISLTNYRLLRWFFESYNGDNNIMRAGAKLLFDLAQQQKAS